MGLTNFPNGISSFGQVVNGGMGIGNVYLVCPTAQTTVYNDLSKKYGGIQYDDETYMLHTTPASALACCVAERNDYVVLMPDDDDYDITATLTMDKKATHLICPGNLGPSVATTNSCRIHNHSGTSCHTITITGGSMEIGGVYCKTSANKYGISIPGTATSSNPWGLWIHHTTVVGAAVSTTDGGIVNSSSTAVGACYSVIEYCKFFNQISGTRHTYGIGMVNATATLVKGNLIVAPNACTLDNGIYLTGEGTTCMDNTVIECSGSTITSAITLDNSTAATGNRIAMATAENAIIGGVADNSKVSNYESTSGGTLAV